MAGLIEDAGLPDPTVRLPVAEVKALVPLLSSPDLNQVKAELRQRLARRQT